MKYFSFFLIALLLGLSWGVLLQIIIWRQIDQQIIFQSQPNSYSHQQQKTPTPSPQPTLLPSPNPSPTPLPSPSPSPLPLPSPLPSPIPSPSPLNIPLSNQQLDQWFIQYSQEHGVEEYTLKFIALCESRMNPNAINGLYAGLFQFSSSTWATTRINMQADPNADLRFNAQESIKTAAWKIAHGGQQSWPNCLP